ncbi:MAG: hypothetical protein ACRDTC_02125 [Pseudonocardiaceae bacterium]
MDQLDTLFDTVVGTALLTFGVITFIVVLRVALWLGDRTLRRGPLPMVIHVGARSHGSSPVSVGGSSSGKRGDPPAADVAIQADRLATEVRAYIEADSRVLLTPAPGGGHLTAPPAQTQIPDQPGQWMAFLLALVTPAKRHYEAWINTDAGHKADLRAYLEITRSPHDQLVLAEVITAKTADELVASVAGACLHHLRQQSTVRRRTPRWEQWHTQEGYRQFRRGLELENALPEGPIDVDADIDNANAALKAYELACALEPANLIPRLSRAQLLERWPERLDEAIELYTMCRDLWPENIETTYRLMAACINAQCRYFDAERAREDTVRSLRRRVLLRRWAQTWLPSLRTMGERNYWASWFLPWHPHDVALVSRRSKRRQFLAALHVCSQAIKLLRAKSVAQNPDPDRDSTSPEPPDVLTVTVQLAELVTRRGPVPALVRLFHPDRNRTSPTEENGRSHSVDWHSASAAHGIGTLALTNLDAAQRHIGWLAHYNTACFLAIASTLPPTLVPLDFLPEHWVHDCQRAAFRELIQVVRDPLSQLQPEWLMRDPNLDPLRTDSEIGRPWKIYMGFPLWTPPAELSRGTDRQDPATNSAQSG